MNFLKSFVMNVRTFVTILLRNLQYNFTKMRGGIKGRLKLFRKFIRFGDVQHPYSLTHASSIQTNGVDFDASTSAFEVRGLVT